MSARGTSFALIWIYWSSLIWVPALMRVLRVKPSTQGWLAQILEIYFWPISALAPMMRRVFGHSVGVIFNDPLLAALVGALLCTAVWWTWFTIRRRLQRRRVYERPF
jgi:hypothetical protein